jgi:hypothetical protein
LNLDVVFSLTNNKTIRFLKHAITYGYCNVDFSKRRCEKILNIDGDYRKTMTSKKIQVLAHGLGMCWAFVEDMLGPIKYNKENKTTSDYLITNLVAEVNQNLVVDPTIQAEYIKQFIYDPDEPNGKENMIKSFRSACSDLEGKGLRLKKKLEQFKETKRTIKQAALLSIQLRTFCEFENVEVVKVLDPYNVQVFGSPHPLVKCGLCGWMNLFDLKQVRDCGTITNQVCSHCLGSLMYESLTASNSYKELDYNTAIEEIDQSEVGMLKMLKLIHCTDWFENWDGVTRDEVIKNDLQVLKKYLNHTRYNVCELDMNVTEDCLDNLSEIYPNMVFKRKPSIMTNHPYLLSDYICMESYIRTISPLEGEDVVLCPMFKGKIGPKTHYWHVKHSLWPDESVECSTTTVCEHNFNLGNVIFGPNILEHTMQEIITLFGNTDKGFAIFYNNYAINDLSCTTRLHKEKIYLFYENMQIPIVLNKESLRVTLNGSFKLTTGNTGEGIIFKLVKETKFFNLFLILRDVEDVKLITVRENRPLTTVTMPIPLETSFFSDFTRCLYANTTCPFDEKLFKFLCIRNITGNCTVEDLRSFGVGYCVKKLKANQREIFNSHLSTTQLEIHVFLCKIIMTRYKMGVDLRLSLSNLMKSKFLTSFVNVAVEKVLSGLISYITENFGASTSQIMEWITALSQDNFSTLLKTGEMMNVLYGETFLSTSLIKSVSINETYLEKDLECGHHTMLCHHTDIMTKECLCCKMKLLNENSGEVYCKCCCDLEDDTRKVNEDITKYLYNWQEPIVEKKLRPNYKHQKKVEERKGEIIENKTEKPNPVVVVHADKVKEVFKSNKELDLDKAFSLECKTFVMYCERLSEYLTSTIAERNVESGILLHYIQKGLYYTSTDTFTIMSLIPFKNSEINTCGYDAYKLATNDDTITLSDFRSITTCEADFSNSDIIHVANIRGKNLVVLHGANTTVINSDPTNPMFGMIAHSTNVSNGTEHWYVCAGRFSKHLNIPLTLLPFNVAYKTTLSYKLFKKPYSVLNTLEFLKLEKELFYIINMGKDYFQTRYALKLIKVNDDFYLSNHSGTANDLKRNLIYEKIGNNLVVTMEKLNRPIDVVYRELERGMELNIPSMREANLLNLQTSMVKEIINDMIVLIHDVTKADVSNLVRDRVKTDVSIIKNIVFLNRNLNKVKTGDLVLIKLNNSKFHAVFVYKNEFGVHFLNPSEQNFSKCTVFTLKKSYNSLVRKLVIINRWDTTVNLQEVFKNYTAVTGPPGSGKSAYIFDHATDEDVIISMTRSNVTNLKNRAYKKKLRIKDINTFEGYLSSQNLTCNVLYIDESSMLQYYDIIPFIGKNKKIVFLGDPSQISYVDMFISNGTRTKETVMDNVEVENLIKLQTITRFGGDLFKIYDEINPGFTNQCEYETTYKFVLTNTNEEVISLIADLPFKVDVCLTFTTTSQNYFKENIDTTLPISNIHAYQGCEAETVLIFQANNNNWNLEVNKKYILSALSRATKNLIWVCHNSPYSVTRLKDLVFSGGEFTAIRFSGDYFFLTKQLTIYRIPWKKDLVSTNIWIYTTLFEEPHISMRYENGEFIVNGHTEDDKFLITVIDSILDAEWIEQAPNILPDKIEKVAYNMYIRLICLAFIGLHLMPKSVIIDEGNDSYTYDFARSRCHVCFELILRRDNFIICYILKSKIKNELSIEYTKDTTATDKEFINTLILENVENKFIKDLVSDSNIVLLILDRCFSLNLFIARSANETLRLDNMANVKNSILFRNTTHGYQIITPEYTSDIDLTLKEVQSYILSNHSLYTATINGFDYKHYSNALFTYSSYLCELLLEIIDYIKLSTFALTHLSDNLKDFLKSSFKDLQKVYHYYILRDGAKFELGFNFKKNTKKPFIFIKNNLMPVQITPPIASILVKPLVHLYMLTNNTETELYSLICYEVKRIPICPILEMAAKGSFIGIKRENPFFNYKSILPRLALKILRNRYASNISPLNKLGLQELANKLASTMNYEEMLELIICLVEPHEGLQVKYTKTILLDLFFLKSIHLCLDNIDASFANTIKQIITRHMDLPFNFLKTLFTNLERAYLYGKLASLDYRMNMSNLGLMLNIRLAKMEVIDGEARVYSIIYKPLTTLQDNTLQDVIFTTSNIVEFNMTEKDFTGYMQNLNDERRTNLSILLNSLNVLSKEDGHYTKLEIYKTINKLKDYSENIHVCLLKPLTLPIVDDLQLMTRSILLLHPHMDFVLFYFKKYNIILNFEYLMCNNLNRILVLCCFKNIVPEFQSNSKENYPTIEKQIVHYLNVVGTQTNINEVFDEEEFYASKLLNLINSWQPTNYTREQMNDNMVSIINLILPLARMQKLKVLYYALIKMQTEQNITTENIMALVSDLKRQFVVSTFMKPLITIERHERHKDTKTLAIMHLNDLCYKYYGYRDLFDEKLNYPKDKESSLLVNTLEEKEIDTAFVLYFMLHNSGLPVNMPILLFNMKKDFLKNKLVNLYILTLNTDVNEICNDLLVKLDWCRTPEYLKTFEKLITKLLILKNHSKKNFLYIYNEVALLLDFKEEKTFYIIHKPIISIDSNLDIIHPISVNTIFTDFKALLIKKFSYYDDSILHDRLIDFIDKLKNDLDSNSKFNNLLSKLKIVLKDSKFTGKNLLTALEVTYERELSNINCKQIGSWPNNTILPVTTHMNLDTAVGKFAKSYLSKISLTSYKTNQFYISLNPNLYREHLVTLNEELPNLYFYENHQLPDALSSEEIFDIMSIYNYGAVKEGHDVLFVNNRCIEPSVQFKHYIDIEKPSHTNKETITYDYYENLYLSLLGKFNESHKNVNNKRPLKEFYNRIILGTEIQYMNANEILEYILKSKEECVYGVVMGESDSLFGKKLGENLLYIDANTSRTVGNCFKNLQRSIPIVIGNIYLNPILINDLCGHSFVKLVIETNIPKHLMRRSISNWIDEETVSIRCPVIETDIVNLIKNKTLIVFKEFNIKRRFVRMLLMRLAASNMTYDEMLAYVRGVLTRSIIDIKGQTYKHNLNIGYYLDSAYIAFMIHTNYMSKMTKIYSLLCMERNSLIIDSIRELILALMGMFGEVTASFVNYLDESKFFGDFLNLGDELKIDGKRFYDVTKDILDSRKTYVYSLELQDVGDDHFYDAQFHYNENPHRTLFNLKQPLIKQENETDALYNYIDCTEVKEPKPGLFNKTLNLVYINWEAKQKDLHERLDDDDEDVKSDNEDDGEGFSKLDAFRENYVNVPWQTSGNLRKKTKRAEQAELTERRKNERVVREREYQANQLDPKNVISEHITDIVKTLEANFSLKYLKKDLKNTWVYCMIMKALKLFPTLHKTEETGIVDVGKLIIYRILMFCLSNDPLVTLKSTEDIVVILSTIVKLIHEVTLNKDNLIPSILIIVATMRSFLNNDVFRKMLEGSQELSLDGVPVLSYLSTNEVISKPLSEPCFFYEKPVSNINSNRYIFICEYLCGLNTVMEALINTLITHDQIMDHKYVIFNNNNYLDLPESRLMHINRDDTSIITLSDFNNSTILGKFAAAVKTKLSEKTLSNSLIFEKNDILVSVYGNYPLLMSHFSRNELLFLEVNSKITEKSLNSNLEMLSKYYFTKKDTLLQQMNSINRIPLYEVFRTFAHVSNKDIDIKNKVLIVLDSISIIPSIADLHFIFDDFLRNYNKKNTIIVTPVGTPIGFFDSFNFETVQGFITEKMVQDNDVSLVLTSLALTKLICIERNIKCILFEKFSVTDDSESYKDVLDAVRLDNFERNFNKKTMKICIDKTISDKLLPVSHAGALYNKLKNVDLHKLQPKPIYDLNWFTLTLPNYSTNLKITTGCYTLKSYTSLLLYSPTGTLSCFFDCLRKALFDDGDEHGLLEYIYSMYGSQTVTRVAMHKILEILNVNFILIDTEKQTNQLVKVNKSNDFITMELQNAGENQTHCILIKLTNIQVDIKKYRNTQKKVVSEMFKKEITEKYSWRQITTNGEFLKLLNFKDNKICNMRAILARLETAQVNYLITNTIKFFDVDIEKCLDGVLTKPALQGANLGIGKILTSEGWLACIFLNKLDVTYIKLLSITNMPSFITGRIWLLKERWLQGGLKKTVIDPMEKEYALNNYTRDKLIQTHGVSLPLLATKTAQMKLDQTLKVHILEFDNRKHHAYDLRDVVEGCNCIFPSYVTNFEKTSMVTTFSNPLNRVVLKNNKVRYAIEINDLIIESIVLNWCRFAAWKIIKIDRTIYSVKSFEGSALNNFLAMGVNKDKAQCKLNTATLTPEQKTGVIYTTKDLEVYLSPQSIVNIMQALFGYQPDRVKVKSVYKNFSTNDVDMIQNEYFITTTREIYIMNAKMLVEFSIIAGKQPIYNKKLVTVESFGDVILRDTSYEVTTVQIKINEDASISAFDIIYEDNFENCDGVLDIDPYNDLLSIDSLHKLLNTDLTHVLEHFKSLDNTGSLSTNETPIKLRTIRKTYMNDTVTYSVPVFTTMCFEELRTITGRLYTINYLRKKIIPTNVMLDMIKKAYFSKRKENNWLSFRTNLLDYETCLTEEWCLESKNPIRKKEDLIKFFENDVMLTPISNINIHLKLESLLKKETISDFIEQESRPIMWHRFAIAAIFSHIFKKIKLRLKTMLKHKIIYADGLNPFELNFYIQHFRDVNYFFENDLTKQDKQTDAPLLEVEMELYRQFGIDSNVLTMWKTVHDQWFFKTRHSQGTRQGMRLTGQATTALGNLITNLQVHANHVLKNGKNIRGMLLLGDDMLMMTNRPMDSEGIKSYIAKNHNMLCKPKTLEHSGNFIRMTAYKKTNGTIGLGPDFKRLRYRYEVTNGVTEIDNKEKLDTRNMSYLTMIGATKDVLRLIKEKDYPLKLEMWYEFDKLVEAISIYYDESIYDIYNDYLVLLKLIRDEKMVTINYLIWSNKIGRT